jgi:hypothetical protein
VFEADRMPVTNLLSKLSRVLSLEVESGSFSTGAVAWAALGIVVAEGVAMVVKLWTCSYRGCSEGGESVTVEAGDGDSSSSSCTCFIACCDGGLDGVARQRARL